MWRHLEGCESTAETRDRFPGKQGLGSVSRTAGQGLEEPQKEELHVQTPCGWRGQEGEEDRAPRGGDARGPGMEVRGAAESGWGATERPVATRSGVFLRVSKPGLAAGSHPGHGLPMHRPQAKNGF